MMYFQKLTATGRTRTLCFRTLLCACLWFFLTQYAHAQTFLGISPGSPEEHRQKQFEQEERKRLMPSPQSAPPLPAEPALPEEDVWLPEGETPCFEIREITLEGNESKRFQFALKAADKVFATGQSDSPGGKCLGTRGVNLLLKRIQNAVIRAGYVTTQVLAAPQGLKDGILRLVVVPGRVRAIRFTEDSRPRIVTWNTIPARPGDILNLRDIEQGLDNLKRAPTAEANFEIVPAGPDAKPGESDLLIRYKQRFPFRLGVSYENSGIKATGRYLGTTSFSYDNPFGLSDLFYVSGTLTPMEGDPSPGRTRSYSLGYSVPFRNWALSFHSDHYEYLQTQPGYLESYAYSGTQDSMDTRLSYMLYRDAHRKFLFFGGLGVKEMRNFLDDTEITVQHRRTSKYSVGFSHREYFNEGFFNAEVTLTQGVDCFGALPAPEEAYGEGVSHPTIYLASLELDYPFKLGPASLRYHGQANGQYGRQPLTPVDRFSIGGRYTVRGFTGDSTLTAENGMALRNELGLALGKSGQELYVAYDYGFVDGPSARWLPGKSLAGGALGLRGGYKIFSYDVFASVPLHAPKDFPVDHLVCGFRISTEFSIK